LTKCNNAVTAEKVLCVCFILYLPFNNYAACPLEEHDSQCVAYAMELWGLH